MKIAWKNLPLDGHQNARPAALAAHAAGEQGRFWEYHDKLFANQQKLSAADLLRYAGELGLDVKRFQADMASPKVAAVVDGDKREATALGVSGTPGFFVNGKFLSGAQPFEAFAQMINAELTRLGLPIPPGGQVAGTP